MRILITFKLLIVDIQNMQNITTECFRQKLCFPEQMTAQTTLFKDKLINTFLSSMYSTLYFNFLYENKN